MTHEDNDTGTSGDQLCMSKCRLARRSVQPVQPVDRIIFAMIMCCEAQVVVRVCADANGDRVQEHAPVA